MTALSKPMPSSTILRVSGSARIQGSITRTLADALVTRLLRHDPAPTLVDRDLSTHLPFVDAGWVNANFTPAEDRSPEQTRALALSDSLVAELQQADVIVLAVPMYNFSIPASVKAWLDLVARVGLTFRYSEHGPEGLLTDKPVYLLMATGGTTVGGPMDFASGYLKHMLGFLGLHDLRVLAMDEVNGQDANSLAAAQTRVLDELIPLQAA